MTKYWNSTRLLYQRLAVYNKPAIVNFEPDFWGYVERTAPQADPTKMAAQVSFNPDCSSLPNNVTGIAQCLVKMARSYSPKAVIGFPPSGWGGDTDAQVVAFMNLLHADSADFIVMQTLDRDAGCFEAATAQNCQRTGGGYYWDETNTTHPNFQDHLITAKAYADGIHLPLIWWQTPQGVPSNSAGTTGHWRDNRTHYFLTHTAELAAAGGVAVVFGAGESTQTTIATDDGQYKTLSTQYFSSPVILK